MELPQIIQGGVGVAISDWNLAKTVSMQGHLGVVSGTGLAQIMTSRLRQGDLAGDIRRALSHFPFQESVKRILDKYYVPRSIKPKPSWKLPPMWTIKPPKGLNELTVIANFVEVFLAKEGHQNEVGFNLLEKVQLPTMASLYGAMLAKIDYVIMGAGIPLQVPGILDKLTNHQPVSYRLDVIDAAKGDEYHTQFDPQTIFPGVVEKISKLTRPYFLPIISSVALAKALIKRATGKVNGFIVEAPSAGGHNAPPRGSLNLDEDDQPIYGEKDEVDLDKVREMGLPFWLAGGQDSPEKLKQALKAGAAGIQVGTAFAYCVESGLEESLKSRGIQKVRDEDITVRTDHLASPTGYPFKVLQLEGTMSDAEIAQSRVRLCNLGMLRELYMREDGKVGYRCSAEPIDQYMEKGGTQKETVGKKCLCNHLCATAGYPQPRKDDYVEPPIVTAGDGLAGIGKYFKPGKTSYTAQDVLDYLTG